MHIVFWSRLSFARDLVIELFSAEPDITFTVCPTLEECTAAIHDADGLVLYNCKPDDARTLMTAIDANAPRLQWMHFLTAGKEGFDAVGFPVRVDVTQTAGASAPVVAEHAMALLLALCRRIPETTKLTADHNWERPGIASRVSSIEGRTMAIVGYGQIGREVARRARAFGMKTIAVSRSGSSVDEFVDEWQPLSSLHATLTRCDVVVLAIALTPDTRHLMDAGAFAACKRGALIVNVSRGGVIDQTALREALTSGALAGAGLDVTDPEPLPATDPLWDSPNLIVSPHIAVEGSPETAGRLAMGALETLRERLYGDKQ